MVLWYKRTPEIANLLNPSFCAVLIYATVSEHQKKSKEGVSFPLLYLILPIILHQSTHDRINSKTNMIVWIQRNPDVLVGFPERARSLVAFTNEAIEFLLFQQCVKIDDGKIVVIKPLSKSKMDKFANNDTEINDCIQKANHVGRWFIKMKSDINIYAAWGVSP